MRISLLKIIDVSILPTVLAVCFKIFGVFLATFLFDLKWQITAFDFFPFSLMTFFPEDSQIFVNSFSQVLMSAALIVGASIYLIQAHYFHETHLPPIRAAELERHNLSSLVTNSFDVFHRCLLWLSLLWFISFLSLFEVYQGTILPWVSVVLLTLSATLTYVFALDLDQEKAAQSSA